jgi:hypothetical protein
VPGYPLSNFEQRSTDLSAQFPKLVGDYLTAREITMKNEQHETDLEELRQAMLHYKAVFKGLLEKGKI